MTKISIIMPVYNVEKYIRESLNSVINQTLADIEIICVDDCSTDKSADIILEYAQNDSRIRFIQTEKNSGPGVARNMALDIAKGEYIMFLDPDDWLDLSACDILYNQAVQNNNDMVKFNFTKYFETKNRYVKVANEILPFRNAQDKKHIVIRHCNDNFFISTYLCFQIIKKELLDRYNIRFSNHRFCEDDIFIVKLYLNSQSMSFVANSLYFYRIHRKSLMRNPNLYISVIETKRKCYEYVKDFCREHDDAKGVLEFFVLYLIHTYIFYFDCLIRRNHKFAKTFYNDIKKFFCEIDDTYPNEYLRKSEDYKIFKEIIKYNWKKYYMLYMLKYIFSFEDRENEKHNTLYILGLKLKIRKNSLKKVQKNYQSVIPRIRNKYKNKEKIRVLFLSNEISKWGYDSIYKLFEENALYEPLVGIFPLSRSIDGTDRTQPSQEEQFNFFKNKGFNVISLYKDDLYKPLKELEPDIVFYQQQWDLPYEYSPDEISKDALTFACSYSYEVLSDRENYTKNYHGKLFKYYIEDELNKQRYKKHKGYSNNCSVVGYLKLDKYLEKNEISVDKYWKNPDKLKVIYAPHHSLDTSDKDCISLATFRENGKFILDYAKTHPQTTWVFKPHPRFKFVIEKEGIMSNKEIDEYYKEWKKIGYIYESGDYIDIFKTSDLMITDCCSFLAEYLPTGKPLIRMINPKGIRLNKLGERICSEYYISHNNKELEEYMNQLIINKNDFKYNKRQELIKTIIDKDKSAADKIFDDIEKIFKG